MTDRPDLADPNDIPLPEFRHSEAMAARERPLTFDDFLSAARPSDSKKSMNVVLPRLHEHEKTREERGSGIWVKPLKDDDGRPTGGMFGGWGFCAPPSSYRTPTESQAWQDAWMLYQWGAQRQEAYCRKFIEGWIEPEEPAGDPQPAPDGSLEGSPNDLPFN